MAGPRDNENHRNKWMILGVMLTGFGVLTTAFSAWISPRIVNDARSEWRKETEMMLAPVVNRLDRIESRIDGYIDRSK